MTTPTIAWLANERIDVDTFIEVMGERGFASVYERHAGQAIDDYTRGRKYSLIVINPPIAPGLDCLEPGIERIMRVAPRMPVDYAGVALQVAKLTKGNDSINKATPIVVTGVYDPENDPVYPHFREACLRTGATQYFDLRSCDLKVFYGKLEQLARGQKNS